jgi:hypothetical protein
LVWLYEACPLPFMRKKRYRLCVTPTEMRYRLCVDNSTTQQHYPRVMCVRDGLSNNPIKAGTTLGAG